MYDDNRARVDDNTERGITVGILGLRDPVWGLDYGDGKGPQDRPNELARSLARIEAARAADETRDAATLAAVTALADTIKAGGGNVDTAAILAEIRSAAAASAVAVERLQAELAASVQREHELRAKLAAAYAEPATP